MTDESDFESATRAMFTEVVTAVPSPKGASQNRIAVDAILRKQILEHIDVLLMVRAGDAFAPETGDQRRFFDALIDGVRTGDIVLRTMGDLSAFSGLILFEFRLFPEVVEYYTKRGELLEVMRLAERACEQIRSISEEEDDPYKGAQIHVLHLYDYDRNREAEHRSKGEDDEAFLELPLEVRTAFSGFFDMPTEDEHHFYDDDISRLLPDGDT